MGLLAASDFVYHVQLISLSDLENDFVNPHDSSAALNKWVVSMLAFMALNARCSCSKSSSIVAAQQDHICCNCLCSQWSIY